MMNQIVIDTNVFVSGVRSNQGTSFRVLQLVFAHKIDFALSVSLAAEYEDVLTRHQSETGFSTAEMDSFIDALYYRAHFIEVHYLWRPFLRDPSDDHVLELAVAASSDVIVTHNLKDFKGSDRFGIQAITPNEYLKQIGEL
jgi:putative PIN family toxin of toxin-antitoxin system